MAKKVLSLLLTLAMVCSFVQIGVFAEEPTTKPTVTITEVTNVDAYKADKTAINQGAVPMAFSETVQADGSIKREIVGDEGAWVKSNGPGENWRQYVMEDGKYVAYGRNATDGWYKIYEGADGQPTKQKNLETWGRRYVAILPLSAETDISAFLFQHRTNELTTESYDIFASMTRDDLFDDSSIVFSYNKDAAGNTVYANSEIKLSKPVTAKWVALAIYSPTCRSLASFKQSNFTTEGYFYCIRNGGFYIYGENKEDYTVETRNLLQQDGELDIDKAWAEYLTTLDNGKGISNNLLANNYDTTRAIVDGQLSNKEPVVDSKAGNFKSNIISTDVNNKAGAQWDNMGTSFAKVEETGEMNGNDKVYKVTEVSDDFSKNGAELIFKLDGKANINTLSTVTPNSNTWICGHFEWSLANSKEDLFTDKQTFNADIYSYQRLVKITVPNGTTATYAGFRVISAVPKDMEGVHTGWAPSNFYARVSRLTVNGEYVQTTGANGDVTAACDYTQAGVTTADEKVDNSADCAVDNNGKKAAESVTKQISVTNRTFANAADNGKVYVFKGWYDGTTLLSKEATFDCPITETARTITAKFGPCEHENGTYGKVGTAVAATCKDAGKEADKHCSDCDALVAAGAPTAVNPDNHQNLETKAATAKEATCKEKGKTAVIWCNDCDQQVGGGVEIPVNPDNHKGTTSKVNYKAATCTAKGHDYDTKCNDCGTIITKGKDIAAKGHKTTNKVTKATTSANGKIVATCSVCKKTVKTTTLYKVSSFKLSTTKYTYNGKVKTPSVTVKDSKGKTLKNGTDYTVSMPKGRKSIGKYTVKITLKGNYSGSKSLSFTIVPKATKVSKVSAGKKALTVKWSKQTSHTTGYQIQYSTSKKFSGAKTVTVSKNKTTSKTISKLKGKKTYYVRVRTYKTVGKTKYYSDWSKAVSKKTKK